MRIMNDFLLQTVHLQYNHYKYVLQITFDEFLVFMQSKDIEFFSLLEGGQMMDIKSFSEFFGVTLTTVLNLSRKAYAKVSFFLLNESPKLNGIANAVPLNISTNKLDSMQSYARFLNLGVEY